MVDRAVLAYRIAKRILERVEEQSRQWKGATGRAYGEGKKNAACLEMWCGAAIAAQEATGREDLLTVQAFIMAMSGRGPYRETVAIVETFERDNPGKVMKE